MTTVADAPSARQRALADEVWAGFLQLFLLRRNQFLETSGELGLTPGETNALLSIDPHSPRTMGELATDWRCDASNVTWIVDRLEEKDLVERRTVPTDRRVKSVALTKNGARTRVAILDRLKASPPELQQLPENDLLALRDALAKADIDPSGSPLPWVRFVHDGARQMGRGARQLQEGARQVKAGAKQLKADAKQLKAGVKADVKRRKAELKNELKPR
jgi:X-X-X-Leu-X-X-Gly heptad repeat protein